MEALKLDLTRIAGRVVSYVQVGRVALCLPAHAYATCVVLRGLSSSLLHAQEREAALALAASGGGGSEGSGRAEAAQELVKLLETQMDRLEAARLKKAKQLAALQAGGVDP